MKTHFFPSADISWWDPTNPQDKRSFVYRKQLHWIFHNLPLSHNQSALDIGAGRGRFTRLALNQGYKVTSIDVNPKMLSQMAKLGLTNKKLVMSGEKLKFKDRQFDVVFAMEVIMHISKIDQFLSEIYRVLKPKGIAFLNITNKKSLYPFWVTKISPYLSQSQNTYPRIQYSSKDFESKIKKTGFSIKAKSGFGVVPPISIKPNWQYTIIPKVVAQATSSLLDPYFGKQLGFCINYLVKKSARKQSLTFDTITL